VSTRDLVLEALRDARGIHVNGEVLAKRLGVSRVSIAKQVGTLRAAGYTIEAKPGTGYLLVGSPDLALPWEVAHKVSSPLWRRFEGGLETASTNEDAKRLARAGEPEGVVVVAASQSGGRGRMGRSWGSPPGGVYASAIFRPPVAPVMVGTLALAMGVGLAWGLERLGAHPELKWPNDVRLADGKVAGLLLEMSAESDRVEWVVAGFGLNVRRPVVPEPQAAYLHDLVPGVGVADAAAAVFDGISEAYRLWLAHGFVQLHEEFARRCMLTGNHVVVSDALGAVRTRGLVEGVDDEGRLLVRDEGGLNRIVAGEVTLRSA
jgi:BirA family biotin operon repressor/biotin-[acetyl-CoA-carboxylase] ligase